MKRIFTFLLAMGVLITITLGAAYAAAPGGSDDPLISLSYLTGYISNIMNRVNSMIDASLGTLKTLMDSQLEEIDPAPANSEIANGYQMLYLKSGGTVTVTMGSSVTLITGTLRITSLSGTLINVSDGKTVSKTDMVKQNNRYFAAENTTVVFTVYSSAAEVTVNGAYAKTESGTLPNSGFTDVSGHWAEEYITYLAGKGIVTGMGDGLFMPDYTMTRAMFVTLIGRLYGADKNAYTSSKFSDVEIGSWYGPYVAWAAEKGIVTGFSDGTFAPNDTITREQMALIIMRYASFSGVSLPQTTQGKTFVDDALIGSWASEAVYAEQKAGLISGRTDNTFDPKGTATRAEVCAIVFRFIKAVNS